MALEQLLGEGNQVVNRECREAGLDYIDETTYLLERSAEEIERQNAHEYIFNSHGQITRMNRTNGLGGDVLYSYDDQHRIWRITNSVGGAGFVDTFQYQFSSSSAQTNNNLISNHRFFANTLQVNSYFEYHAIRLWEERQTVDKIVKRLCPLFKLHNIAIVFTLLGFYLTNNENSSTGKAPNRRIFIVNYGYVCYGMTT